jgi:hypothetical protein
MTPPEIDVSRDDDPLLWLEEVDTRKRAGPPMWHPPPDFRLPLSPGYALLQAARHALLPLHRFEPRTDTRHHLVIARQHLDWAA